MINFKVGSVQLDEETKVIVINDGSSSPDKPI